MPREATSPAKRRGRPRKAAPAVLVSIRMPERLRARIAAEARAKRTTITAIVRDVLDRHGPRGTV